MMSKAAEQAYLENTGEGGRAHSLFKPFSDPHCGVNLASKGIMMTLLPPPPAHLLDLGCGGGWTSVFFALRGYRVTGQDIAASMIDLAHENRARHGLAPDQLEFICGDYESQVGDEQYDCAVFFDSLHHADDEALAIQAAYRALRPGGVLLTHEPGEGHSTSPHSIAAMEQYGVNERDMPPSLIVRRGMEAGFSSFRVLPMPHEILEIFYGERKKSSHWFTRHRRRRRMFRRLDKLLFEPSMAASSIVLLTK